MTTIELALKMEEIPIEGIDISLFCYVCESKQHHHVTDAVHGKNGQVEFLSKCNRCETLLPLENFKVKKCGETLVMDKENYGSSRIPLKKWNRLVNEALISS